MTLHIYVTTYHAKFKFFDYAKTKIQKKMTSIKDTMKESYFTIHSSDFELVEFINCS